VTSDIHKTSLLATSWSAVATYVDRAMRFVVFIVVSRLVGPAQFGMVLLSLMLVETLQVLLDTGLSKALVQQKEVSKPQLDTAFFVTMAVAIVTATCLLSGAPIVGNLVAEPEATPLIRTLAAVPLINGAAQIHVAILQRELDFKALAARRVAPGLVAGAVAIMLAVAGFGAWALIAGALVRAAGETLSAWLAASYRPGLRFEARLLREVLPMGLRLWGAALANQINGRGFDYLAGLFLGMAALGALRVAGQTVLLVIELSLGPITNVGFAILSRYQHDAALFAQALVSLARLSAVMIFPAFAGLLVVADPLLPLVFGSRWAPAAAITPFMCVIAPALYWQMLASAALFAAGRADRLLRFALIEAALTLVLGLAAARFGLVGIAAAGSLRLYLMVPVTWRWVRHDLAIDPHILLVPALPSLMASLAMTGILFFAKAQLSELLTPAALVAALVGVGIASYALLLPVLSKLMAQPLPMWPINSAGTA
jgi:O-antigen/teichoic acid export membrane protein